MKKKSPEEQKDYIKKLWQEDTEKYYEWKDVCIHIGTLPDLFGHDDNPMNLNYKSFF